ncbi:hypothetical protein L6164_005691 [Bauhinia variegata]|uniref:Uncharacterized protein n=1 Tax=Bauhinia variegata TaxID=167791 RepID=A0ACB9PU64_BAUVA|nr:hypothetical protein L6164_005691 [Bauhinia variegata]
MVDKFKHLLEEGKTYMMTNFEVLEDDQQLRVSKLPYKLKFVRTTTIRECVLANIPVHAFLFTPFEEILSKKAPSNVLVSGLYPAGVQSYWTASKLFIDEDIKEINEFKASLAKWDDSVSVQYSQYSQSSQMTEDEKFLKNAHVKAMFELQHFKEANLCVTVGRIAKVYTDPGWFFYACTKCGKKTNPIDQGKYRCGQCKTLDSTPHTSEAHHLINLKVVMLFIRYRVEVLVHDDENHARFVLWDRECMELIGHIAGVTNFNEFPQAVDDLAGKICAFKIKPQIGGATSLGQEISFYVLELTDTKDLVDTLWDKVEHIKTSMLVDSQSQEGSVGFVTPSNRLKTSFLDDDAINLSSGDLSTTKCHK